MLSPALANVAYSLVHGVVDRLRRQGAELLDEIAQYEDQYRLCFVRGPEGILVGLAEQLQ